MPTKTPKKAVAPAKKAKKPVQKSSSAPAKTRRRGFPGYKTFKPAKRVKHPGPRLPSGYQLLKQALTHLLRHWKIFVAFLLIYAVVNLFLTRGFGGDIDLNQLKTGLHDVFKGKGFSSDLTIGLALFGVLLGTSSSTTSEVVGAYQSIMILLTSLGLIWLLRQTYDESQALKLRARDGYYKGMYPLIPFILVLIVITLQLIPLALAGFIYTGVLVSGLAVTVVEQILWGALVFLLVVLSLYMITSSLFALYIVTLPDMTPMRALRSARQLVLYRRWTVLRKLLFLLLAILVLGAVIMLPLIMYLTPLAAFLFYILSVVGLAVIHSYMYSLYRALL